MSDVSLYVGSLGSIPTRDHDLLTGLSDDDHPQYVLHTEVDDTPVDGVTTDPISSNWAFDHVAAADPHTGYRLESADHTHASSGLQAGTVDHGALTGLTDDDHTQYRLESADHSHQSTGLQGGVLALAALKVDEQSGNSTTAATTAGADLVTLTSMTVTAGDRIFAVFRIAQTLGAASTRLAITIQQSAGTATGNFFSSTGPATTTASSIFTSVTDASLNNDTLQHSGMAYIFITGSGTITLKIIGTTLGGDAASSGGNHFMALVLRGV